MCHKILFSCVLLTSILLSPSYAEKDIIIVTEEWPPYNYVENGELTGFSTEIVQNMLKILKKHYEIRMVPSMRSTYVLNTRPHTMMFSLFRTPERESQYKWIGPLGDGAIYFYKRRNLPLTIESLEDLKNVNLKVCCRHEGLIPSLLQEKGFKNLDLSAINSVQIYKKLLMERCDLVISETDLGVKYHLNSLHVDMDDVLEKIPIPIFEAELYLAGSQDIPDEEIQQWQSALETLKANGIYEKIFRKYDRQQSK